MTAGRPDPAVTVTRDGVVESAHLAHVVVADGDGSTLVVVGDGSTEIYPRSALKPFQAMAVCAMLAGNGHRLAGPALAIACASHTGSDDHQIQAAAVLAEADLDERALRCPVAWPEDPRVRSSLRVPTSLSHNCSGKHAAMLWAHTAAGQPAGSYLDPTTPLQTAITTTLTRMFGAPPAGPGVDGCGAPAWRCAVSALATGAARLAAGVDEHSRAVRTAMTAHPFLVGGHGLPDTALMWADTRVVAKRGADGVMAAGFAHPTHGPLGVAVKVVDGGDRAAGPLAAAVLHALGAEVPADVRHPPVLGGGVPHGRIQPDPAIARRVTQHYA